MSTWLDDYKRRLDGIVATKQAGVSLTGNNDLASAYAALAASSRGPINPKTARAYANMPSVTAKANRSAAGTAFNAAKSGGSRLIDLLSRPNYTVMNTIKEMSQPGVNDENFFEAMWKGFSGQEKTTGRDVLKQNYPHMGNKTRAITGLVGDIFLDPTTYIGAGLIGKVGKLAGIGKGARAVGDASKTEVAAKVLTQQEKAGAVGEDSANALLDHIQRNSTKPKNLEDIPFQNQPFTPKVGSTLQDVVHNQKQTELITARANAAAVTDELGNIPVRRYSPDTISKIAAPYNTTIEAPVAPVKVARKSRGLSRAAATEEANYRYLLTNPEHKIPVPLKSKPGETTLVDIKTLQGLAAKSPENAKMVDTLLHKAAKNLDNVDDDARIFLGNRKGAIPTSSVGGSLPSAALTRGQFIKLLETGEVPKNKGKFFYGEVPEDAPLTEALKGPTKTDAFPLHDAEDLDGFSVMGLNGQAEPVGKFLERIGVRVKQVDPAKQTAPSGGLGDVFDNVPDFSGKTSPRKFSALSKKDQKAWVEAHKDLLDPEDIKALLSTKISAKSDKAYKAALKKIGDKTTKGVSSVDALMEALKNGAVNPDDLKKLMTLTGAKTPEGIKKGINRILKAVEKAENAAKADAEELAKIGKLWDTGGPVNVLPEAPIPVKSASEILSDLIKKGDDSSFVHIKDSLDPKQLEDLDAVLKYAVDKEIVDPSILEKYGFVTRSGTKRTHPKLHAGRGRNLTEWNTYSQLTMFNGVIARRSKEVGDALKGSGLSAQARRAARSSALYDHVVPIMRAFDKILVENGIPPTLTTGRAYTLGLADVISAFPKPFVEKHLFDLLKDKKGNILHENIPPTVWNDAASIVLDYSRGLISESAARSALAGTFVTDHIVTHSRKILKLGTAAKARKLAETSQEVAQRYIGGIVDEFMGRAQTLSQAVETKAAELAANNIDGAKAITEETMKSFASRIADPHFVVTDIFSMANDQDAIMESIAKSLGVTSDTAKTIAKTDVMVKSAEIIPPEVMAEAKGAEAMANVMAKKGAQTFTEKSHIAHGVSVVRVAEKQMANAAESAAPFVDDMPVTSLNDLMQEVEATFTWKILHNWAPHLRNADVRPIYLAGNSATQTSAKAFQRKIGGIAKTYSNDEVTAAYRSLQMGVVPANAKVAEAAKEIRQVITTMFRDDKYDIFSRTGITPVGVNQKLAHFGIPDKFALDTGAEFKDSWKKWSFGPGESPLDIFAKYQAAVGATVMERQLGAKLSLDFGSKVPKAGYVKILNDNARLSQLLDPEMYFPREIASQFSVLNNLLNELAKPAGNHAWVNLYDHVLHSYKTGLTIYRPGHHFRNMVGDMWFSWMDGVNNPAVYSKAMSVMRDNWGQYTDWNALQALNVAGETNAKLNKAVTFTRVAGKKKELTTGEIFQAARSRGILPDYATLEDIGTNAERTMWKPHLPGKAKGKVHDFASTASESRDHYVRLAHFIDRVQKSNGQSLDKIFDDAAARVRKWHPDGSDLTQFENKVMRRSMLFYSWQRKAIPLVIESILHKPGKVMIYPKAMYALAEANGVDPNSFSDPFPDDQMFPDFIREDVTGPQFDIGGMYWGINPGVPAVDVLNDYGNSPGHTIRNIAGSMPMGIKQLVEYVSADQSEGELFKDIRTGVPQSDLSDYVDSQLPGVSYLAKVTGRSPSSLGTQEVRQSSGMSPEELQKAKDKNTAVDNLTALFNFMTGSSATNMSKPGYIKSAQFDQKAAAKKALKDATR